MVGGGFCLCVMWFEHCELFSLIIVSVFDGV